MKIQNKSSISQCTNCVITLSVYGEKSWIFQKNGLWLDYLGQDPEI